MAGVADMMASPFENLPYSGSRIMVSGTPNGKPPPGAQNQPLLVMTVAVSPLVEYKPPHNWV